MDQLPSPEENDDGNIGDLDKRNETSDKNHKNDSDTTKSLSGKTTNQLELVIFNLCFFTK